MRVRRLPLPATSPFRRPLGRAVAHRVGVDARREGALIDHYRGDGSAPHEPLEEAREERLGSETLEPNLGIEPDLAEALATLSRRDREVVALRFGADLSGLEIAELSGLSVDNVQQILSRSLRSTAHRAGGEGERIARSSARAGDQPAAFVCQLVDDDAHVADRDRARASGPWIWLSSPRGGGGPPGWCGPGASGRATSTNW